MAEPDRGGPVDCILIKMEILILGGGRAEGRKVGVSLSLLALSLAGFVFIVF